MGHVQETGHHHLRCGRGSAPTADNVHWGRGTSTSHQVGGGVVAPQAGRILLFLTQAGLIAPPS